MSISFNKAMTIWVDACDSISTGKFYKIEKNILYLLYGMGHTQSAVLRVTPGYMFRGHFKKCSRDETNYVVQGMKPDLVTCKERSLPLNHCFLSYK